MIDTEEKEYAAMTDNEKVRLEVLVTQKDEALSASETRVSIYKEAWVDAERENAKLRGEKAKQHTRIMELEDTVMRLQEANKPSLGRNLGPKLLDEQLEADILDLEKQNEHLLAVLNNVRNVLIRVSGEIESVAQVD
jgi:chromosome segregation ATPase